MAQETVDPRVDKRKVTMRNASLDASGKSVTLEAVDYVRPDILEAYLADARSKWQFVDVAETPDAGPGGYEGQTPVPDALGHPLAGQTFAAEKKGGGGGKRSSSSVFSGLGLMLSVLLLTFRVAGLFKTTQLMVVQTTAMKNLLADAYKAAATYAAGHGPSRPVARTFRPAASRSWRAATNRVAAATTA